MVAPGGISHTVNPGYMIASDANPANSELQSTAVARNKEYYCPRSV